MHTYVALEVQLHTFLTLTLQGGRLLILKTNVVRVPISARPSQTLADSQTLIYKAHNRFLRQIHGSIQKRTLSPLPISETNLKDT
jgi:hypothetical protein